MTERVGSRWTRVSRRFLAAGLCLALAVAGGCGKDADAEREPDLICFVGGTMLPAMTELASMYEEKTGVKVGLDKAGSGELMTRIASGAKADLYVSHDPYLDQLFARGLGSEGWTVAAITPAIVVAPGNPEKVTSFADLANPDLRVVLTDFNRSTLGHMLPTMFRKAGVDFEAKIKNGQHVKTFRSGGKAANTVAAKDNDVAVVWNAVAHLLKPKIDVVEISKEHLPAPGVQADTVTSATGTICDISTIRVTIATVKASPKKGEARKFAEFVTSPEAREVWRKMGFTMVKVKKEHDQR